MAFRRLVTGAAAIAMLGCSDGATESTPEMPSFSGPLPTIAGGAADNVTGVPEPEVSTENPEPGSNLSDVGEGGGESLSESSTPENISLDNTEGSESTGSQAAGEQSAGEVQTPAAEQSDAQEAESPADEATDPPAAEPEPVVEEEAEPEPEPIVRPPLNCGAPPAPLEGVGVQGCDVNDNGSVGGQSWFLWYDGGSGCMTTHDNLSGAFTAQWNNPGDFLARIGFWFDETQTYRELGELGADLSFTKQGSAGGFSFIGIYGWTTSPLIEYYIVEDSFGNGPAQPFNTQLRGSFNVDGAIYNVYSGTRNNQPSIVGTANFQQFFSVRQNPRQCGHVSISEHFRQWESMGMNLGLMYESKILVESGGGNGSITFDHANVTLTPPGN